MEPDSPAKPAIADRPGITFSDGQGGLRWVRLGTLPSSFVNETDDDAEFYAMRALAFLLDHLSAPQATRVLRWVTHKFADHL